MTGQCMVNHEMEEGLFFALLEKQRETRAMLQRAVALLNIAAGDMPYWPDGEVFLDEAEELLARTDPGKMKVWQPGEEPF